MNIFLEFLRIIFTSCVLSCFECSKYNSASISELTFITREGKQLWDSLSEKVKLPQYGPCWKKAISNLELGCKFLSEDVQSDLALRFADCFLQMSGYEPLICNSSKEVCLRNLPDRAFNAYTEFYTHTQSICYFLQSQVWHEEAQRTIDKLSDTTILVTAQLMEAGHVQRKILDQQKESLLLQHYLLDNGKTIASALELSEEKIAKIMKDFEKSAAEQKKALFELFDKLTLLHSWVVGEMSWINSIIFYMTAMVIGYLCTSISCTSKARIYILLSLTINYVLERYIYLHFSDQILNDYSGESLNSWIWFTRKIFVGVSIALLIYSAIMYCDYNTLNYKLLLDIKNQNSKILNFFERDFKANDKEKVSTNIFSPNTYKGTSERISLPHFVGRGTISKDYTVSPLLTYSKTKQRNSLSHQSSINIDDIDNVSVVSEKSGASVLSVKNATPYNLRSSRNRK